jgi:plasmid maintenance system antidote protein VapI
MVKNGMRPVHPGEILREEYLVPMGMSVHALSQALRVPATRLHEIVKERLRSRPIRHCGLRATSARMRSPV